MLLLMVGVVLSAVTLLTAAGWETATKILKKKHGESNAKKALSRSVCERLGVVGGGKYVQKFTLHFNANKMHLFR